VWWAAAAIVVIAVIVVVSLMPGVARADGNGEDAVGATDEGCILDGYDLNPLKGRVYKVCAAQWNKRLFSDCALCVFVCACVFAGPAPRPSKVL